MQLPATFRYKIREKRCGKSGRSTCRRHGMEGFTTIARRIRGLGSFHVKTTKRLLLADRGANNDHFTAQRRIFQLAARGYSSAGVFLRYFTAGIHYCQLRRPETRCTVYARRFSARIRGCTKRGGVPRLSRESSHRRAKKEANGVEAFAYSTQETCSTGLTWPTASLSLPGPRSLLPPSRPIHVNLHRWAGSAARTQRHARRYIASNPFVPRAPSLWSAPVTEQRRVLCSDLRPL